MASKLYTSTRARRAVNPPGPLRARPEGGSHETAWRSTITLERQRTDLNPPTTDFYNFRLDREPAIVRRIVTKQAKR